MVIIKDRYGKNLTEAEEIKTRWQEYRRTAQKQSRQSFMVAQPRWYDHSQEPDILECKVKWALGSIAVNKASGDDGIPVELFLILKDDAVKVLHSICQQIWKNQQWPQDWQRSVFIPIPKKAMPKNAQTIVQLHSSHTLVK